MKTLTEIFMENDNECMSYVLEQSVVAPEPKRKYLKVLVVGVDTNKSSIGIKDAAEDVHKYINNSSVIDINKVLGLKKMSFMKPEDFKNPKLYQFDDLVHEIGWHIFFYYMNKYGYRQAIAIMRGLKSGSHSIIVTGFEKANSLHILAFQNTIEELTKNAKSEEDFPSVIMLMDEKTARRKVITGEALEVVKIMEV